MKCPQRGAARRGAAQGKDLNLLTNLWGKLNLFYWSYSSTVLPLRCKRTHVYFYFLEFYQSRFQIPSAASAAHALTFDGYVFQTSSRPGTKSCVFFELNNIRIHLESKLNMFRQ